MYSYIRWNFQSNFVFWGYRMEPATMHFAGTVKPWSERAWPFVRYSKMYDSICAGTASELTIEARYNLQKSARHLVKMVRLRTQQRAQLRASCDAISLYEQSAVV